MAKGRPMKETTTPRRKDNVPPLLQRTGFSIPDIKDQQPRKYMFSMLYNSGLVQRLYVDDYNALEGLFIVFRDGEEVAVIPSGANFTLIRTDLVKFETLEDQAWRTFYDQKDTEEWNRRAFKEEDQPRHPHGPDGGESLQQMERKVIAGTGAGGYL